MNQYLITLIFGGERIERNVIAASSIQAMITGIRIMPQIDVPCAITCKPVLRVAA